MVHKRNVLITSAGSRTYLAKWFREAKSKVGCDALIILGDADKRAPAFAAGDVSVVLPAIAAPQYTESLLDICSSMNVGLVFSLHDYDIVKISTQVADQLRDGGVALAIPPAATVDTVADKLRMTRSLAQMDLVVPFTTIASEIATIPTARQWVIKHRFGSGSSGVFMVGDGLLSHAILLSAATAPDRRGDTSGDDRLSRVLVQERVEGTEYGLDVVSDFKGAFQGVLARKKLRMRAGETDRAVTVDAAAFEPLARKLASSLELRGNTDVDVIVTPEGQQYVIDINPRFGGGYPFMHMAGANVPACYIAWTLGREIDPSWLQYEIGVVSSKYEAIQRSGV